MALLVFNMKHMAEICRQWQDNEFDGIIVFDGRRGLGKTQTKGSKVLMSDGSWKNIEDIKKGDEIISPQKEGPAKFEKVIEIHSRFEPDIYDILQKTRDKKLLYSCSFNHEIPIIRSSMKELPKINGKRKRKSIRIHDCYNAEKLSKIENKQSHYTSFSSPKVKYKHPNSPINPYCLGAWLGDGYKTRFHVGNRKKEVMDYFKSKGYISKISKKDEKNCMVYSIPSSCDFINDLKRLNLIQKKSGSKFIPEECLLSDVSYRLNLLAGLIDTDGYVMKKNDNHIEITTKSEQLAKNIQNLVFSLGGYSNIRKIKKRCQNNFIGTYYSVSVSFENPHEIPLKNNFKRERLGSKMKHNPRHIAIQSIKRKEGAMVYGFSISGNSKWYITDNWMVTHNSTGAIRLAKAIKRHFTLKRDILFSREDVMHHLATRKGAILINDEAINTVYNRDFFADTQKKILKMLNMYRDSRNVVIWCVPNFYDLDKQFRSLVKMRIHVIRRGVAVIHSPNQSSYSTDNWDTAVNEKIERKWAEKKIFKPKYNRLTTFRGFLRYRKLKDKDAEVYEEVKQEKRNKLYEEEMDVTDKGENKFELNLLNQIKSGKVTVKDMQQACLLSNKKYSNVRSWIATRLRDEGYSGGVKALESKRDRLIEVKEKVYNLSQSP